MWRIDVAEATLPGSSVVSLLDAKYFLIID